jgi:hypothetical protein
VFENRMLRKIFGPKKDEVLGGWRKLRHNSDFIYGFGGKARKKETTRKD